MLKGIFPAIPTCFTELGEIDMKAQKRVIDFVISAGANGIVFPGTASEYNFLSPEERVNLMELLVNQTKGELPIIAGIGANSIKESILLGKQATLMGIDHFMLMAPSRFEKDVSKHRLFFLEVANALPQGKIILQNAPFPIGAGLNAHELIAISKDNPRIHYIKEETLPSGPTISALLNQELPHLLGIFGGGGSRYIIDELRRGCIGAVPAAEITDLHVAIYTAYIEGDLNKARALYQKSLPLLTAQTIYRMRLTKYVFKIRGITDNLYVRAPLPKLDALGYQDIDNMFEDLQKEQVLL